MYLLNSLSEDIVHIVGEESFLKALFACRVDTFADNSRLIDIYAVYSRAGDACADYLSWMSLHAGKRFYHSGYVLRSSTAAAAEYGHTCFSKLYCTCGEVIGVNVVFICNRVGQTCVRFCNNRESCERTYPVKNREKLIRSERAVYTDSICAQTFKHSDHTLRGNACECTHILLKCHSDEDRLVGILFCSENSRFYLIEVGHGLDDYYISLFSCENELLVDLISFLKFKSARRFEKLTYRTHIKSNKSLSCGCCSCVFHACRDDFLNGMTAFCKLEAVCAESIGVDYISPALNVKAVYFHYSFGVGQVEKFGYVFCLYTVRLQHSAHAAVKKYKIAAFKQGIEFTGHIDLLDIVIRT